MCHTSLNDFKENDMIPVVLGTVALGAVGYGVSKLITDDEFRDYAKDKVQDGTFKIYESIELLEDKIGLNDFSIDKDEFNDENIEVSKLNQFDRLYQLKITIRDKLLHDYKLTILENKSDIKKDKIKNIILTEQMLTNLASYEYLLTTAYSKIKFNMDHKTDADIMQYINLLKELFTTKIIKKSTLNVESSVLIINGTHIVLGQRPPIHVELNT